MAIKNDIYYINWIKAAFVASLRSAFGIVASGTVGNAGGLSASDTALYPAIPTASGTFMRGDYLTIQNVIGDDVGSQEICTVSGVTTLPSGGNISVLTLSRGQMRTKAVTHASGTSFYKSYVPPQYRYYDDEEATRIQIYTAFPLRNFKAPTIVVDAKTGGASVSYLGPQEEIGSRTTDGEGHVYFSGILRLSIDISIYASSMTDAEKLSDFVIVFLRFFLRDKLADLRLGYTQVDFGGMTTEDWNGENLYVANISVGNVHSEYELVFPKSLLDYITQINIEERVQSVLDEEIILARVP
jgi:hypothetical protein